MTENCTKTMCLETTDCNWFDLLQIDELHQGAHNDPWGEKIEVQWHEVGFGQYHTLIRITPVNQEKWSKDERFSLKDFWKKSYITLGAGPAIGMDYDIGLPDFFLTKGYNRDSDKMPHGNGITLDIDIYEEDEFIKKIFRKFDNYKDYLNYDIFPEKRDYNSNSFISGLLQACNIPIPILPPMKSFPGWNQPVPNCSFDQ